jgi:sRNA-binding protein
MARSQYATGPDMYVEYDGDAEYYFVGVVVGGAKLDIAALPAGEVNARMAEAQQARTEAQAQQESQQPPPSATEPPPTSPPPPVDQAPPSAPPPEQQASPPQTPPAEPPPT